LLFVWEGIEEVEINEPKPLVKRRRIMVVILQLADD
jgi:hypothetical protein